MMRRLFLLILVASFAAMTLLIGCHSKQPTSSTASNFKIYKVRGKVVSTNTQTGEVNLDSEAIPGFMEAMTMPYKLKDPSVLSELHPGDRISADLLVSENPDADVLLDHIVVIAQGRADYKPSVQYHVPAPGDQVPDFKLTNQDGKPIHFSQYSGKSLLVTFIYTRCPLPNFCPRVTRNFAAIEDQLAANPALYAKTHLLCISFDPENDTPARLRAYGVTYMGGDAKASFKHWEFAVTSKQNLPELAHFFNVGLTNEADSTITHTLSTTLIGADGKVVRFYPGNEWTADQISTDLRQLLKL